MERSIRLDWQPLVQEAIRRRKMQKLTQTDFAKLIGISKPTLIKFEQGHLNISLENAFKILRALGLLEFGSKV